MTTPPPPKHVPYDYALSMINQVADAINSIGLTPDGAPRNLPADVAVGALQTRSNIAIAAALLAVADATRETPRDH